ncbi:MAG TPA: hypothetical protein VMB21_17400 [Candidatus Limnocylindria bacterium]|jgi:hypothetical protein|nr:hypothetical protein [Candidatus Limnocylindria bacterium]HTL66194.1 hypothetical protein [Lacunisphaera sp.]
MLTFSVKLAEPTAAEYFEAADLINSEFKGLNPPMDANTLVAFMACPYDSREICARFELALRAARGIPVPDLPNPVIK